MRDRVLKNLREDRDAARKAGQYGPAVRADELMGKHLAMFTDVSKNVVVDDVSPEEGLRDLCTVDGVLFENAYRHGMELLRLLRSNDRASPPPEKEPTQPAPGMIQ